ncbi:MAG: restriction endonuclease, partial [Fimbriimonadales bacterium]|nr:restriction endonuclease [Fimbriimonadales bacterium]
MGKVVSSRYARMFGPLLDALRDAGGEGNPRELSRKVADLVVTDLAERNRLNATGTNAAENEVAWARETLKRAQLIDSSERGVWKLTDLGWKSFLTIEDAIKIRKQVSHELQQTRKQSTKFELDESDSLPESFGEIEIDQTSLLDVMRSLPPKGFERLCSRLLQELGFVGVEVTGRSGDGGIDGHGLIRVNDLVSFTVIF